MVRITDGGGTGGGGFLVVSGSPFASTAARDVWAAANSGDLVADQSIAQITGGDWWLYTGPNTDDWIDATPIVQGPAGAGTDFSGITENHIPVIGANSVPEDSGITVEERGTIKIPGATLGIGDLLEMSEATGFALIHNNITGQSYLLLDAELSQTTGSARPSQPYVDASTIETRVFQSDTSQTLTDNPLSATYTTTLEAATFWLELQTAAAMTNVKMRLIDQTTGVVFKYAPSELAWENASVAGYNFRNGVNRLNFMSKAADDPANGQFYLGISPFALEANTPITIELKADNVSILGNSSGVPYFQGLSGLITQRGMAWMQDVDAKEDGLGNPADDGSALFSQKDGTRSWGLIATHLEALTGDNRLDFNALKNIPSGFSVPEFTEFTIGTQGTEVDAPFTFSGSTPYTYAMNNPENIGLLTILDGDLTSIAANITAQASGSGFALVPLGDPITLQAGESHTFTIRGTSTLTGNALIQRTYTVTARQSQDFVYLQADDNNTASDIDTSAATAVAFASGNQVVTIPTWSGNRYLKIAQRAADPEITQIQIGGINQFGAFTKTDDALMIGGQQFDVYVTNNLWIGSVWSGVEMTLVRSTS